MFSSETQPIIQSKVEQSCLCLNSECATLNSRQAQSCRHCGASLEIHHRYRILREIGQGQFAKTYEAIDQQASDTPCIVKQFYPKSPQIDARSLELARSLFQQEALILQRLGAHPQIPHLLGYVVEGERQYLIQEFIDGRSLYHRVSSTPNDFDINIEALLLDILPVLEFVHSHNIVHRDIKLGNIIHATSGKLWLIDFGSAFHQNFGRFGISGTPGYAAPEQLKGRASAASDLYSLAVTCLSLISGNILDTALPQYETPTEFLSCLQSQSQLPLKLAQILERMLQPRAEDRYASAQAVIEALNSPQPVMGSIDYSRLQWLLAQEDYQGADQETWLLLLKLAHTTRKLTLPDVEKLPIADLRMIDQLWSTASQGRFGFSAQFRLYQHHLSALQDLNYSQWQTFAEAIGWCRHGEWVGYQQLDFSINSPVGHLPAAFATVENRQGYASGPLNWWRLGFISFMEQLFIR